MYCFLTLMMVWVRFYGGGNYKIYFATLKSLKYFSLSRKKGWCVVFKVKTRLSRKWRWPKPRRNSKLKFSCKTYNLSTSTENIIIKLTCQPIAFNNNATTHRLQQQRNNPSRIILFSHSSSNLETLFPAPMYFPSRFVDEMVESYFSLIPYKTVLFSKFPIFQPTSLSLS